MTTPISAGPSQARLRHIEAHLAKAFDIDKLVRYVTEGLGDPLACLLSLASHARAKAIHAWFASHDLSSFKAWCSIEARLRLRYDTQKPRTYGPLGTYLELFAPLMSDDEQVIHRRADLQGLYDTERREQVNTLDFLAFQGLIALSGDWDRLRKRSEQALTCIESTQASKLQLYKPDQRFYRALAIHDEAEMTAALNDLLSPVLLRQRQNDESGYTQDLLSTPATLLAKIAWRHGHKISVNSPYFPQEWLPVQPLQHYDAPYAFLMNGQ